MSLSSLCTLPCWPLCPLGRRAHRLETTALVYFSENISTASWTEDAASCHSPSLKELQTASRSSVSFLLWNIYFFLLCFIFCIVLILSYLASSKFEALLKLSSLHFFLLQTYCLFFCYTLQLRSPFSFCIRYCCRICICNNHGIY